jgi:hypothetical protein
VEAIAKNVWRSIRAMATMGQHENDASRRLGRNWRLRSCEPPPLPVGAMSLCLTPRAGWRPRRWLMHELPTLPPTLPLQESRMRSRSFSSIVVAPRASVPCATPSAMGTFISHTTYGVLVFSTELCRALYT